MAQTIEIVEDAVDTPICPHCELAITRVLTRKVKALFGVRSIYYCSNCKKTLGFSHRKGFFMG